mmetsp:Transcript_24334/g.35675  ORF Transcript_24334/g.35675 Transcript_24334/m.35675 type:complete len:603 (+) Transcript_24334:63-1871(+)
MSTSVFNRVLPAPVHKYSTQEDDGNEPQDQLLTEEESTQKRPTVPAYMNRANFVPYKDEDFGDGGAFPEIHVAQYPLGMGRPGAKSTAVISVDVDEKGEVRYDAIVKHGANRNKIVQSSLDDMKESEGQADTMSLPSKEEEEATAENTRKALEALLEGKIKKAKPSSIATAPADAEEPKYIRYTPNPNAPGYNPAAKQRVIRMVEAQVDPMEPPKHKIKKVPRGGGSPPVPVLHSPPRNLTVKDQQAWKIPPCVSNWKNARGYTIPLDKRLAADGRGLQEVTINNKFASLTETLYIAERKAAEELRVRNMIRHKLMAREKEDKEKELREMASQARKERASVLGGGQMGQRVEDEPTEEEASHYQPPRRSHSSDDDSDAEHDREENRRGSGGGRRERDRSRGRGRSESRSASPDRRRRSGETDEERTARIQRERLRIERRKEREREIRLENMKGTMRKNKIDRDMNRDVSEKIALGMHKGSGQLTGEAMYDARLFNQSAGMDSGFGQDDEYNTYSKPLFDRKEAESIYRPKRDDADVYGDVDTQMAKLSDTSRFKPDKGFKGAEGSGQGGGRTAPVQFEKVQDDPFGIDDIVDGSSRKKARKN